MTCPPVSWPLVVYMSLLVQLEGSEPIESSPVRSIERELVDDPPWERDLPVVEARAPAHHPPLHEERGGARSNTAVPSESIFSASTNSSPVAGSAAKEIGFAIGE